MYEGKLVRLRAHEPDDADFFYRALNDREVTRFLMLRYPMSRWDERDWIERNRSLSYDSANFVIEAKADGRIVGGVGLRTQGPENRCADLGIAVSDRSQWGKGYGTDAMRTVCRFGFEEMDLHRIELWVFADNERARHVYEKVGFVLEGTARERFHYGGRRVDEHLMGLLRREFAE